MFPKHISRFRLDLNNKSIQTSETRYVIVSKHLRLQRELTIYHTSYERVSNTQGISKIVSEYILLKGTCCIFVTLYVIEFRLIEFNLLYELYGFQKSRNRHTKPEFILSVLCAFTFSINSTKQCERKKREYLIFP